MVESYVCDNVNQRGGGSKPKGEEFFTIDNSRKKELKKHKTND